MAGNNITYELYNKVNSGTASQLERDRYMLLLAEQGAIPMEKYEQYKQGRNTDELVKVGLVIGGFFLLGLAIAALVEKK